MIEFSLLRKGRREFQGKRRQLNMSNLSRMQSIIKIANERWNSPMNEIRMKPRLVGTVLLAGLVVSLIVLGTIGFAEPVNAAPMMHHMDQAGMSADMAPHGFTDGWFDGQTVQFFYTKDFFCQPPPSSGAPSLCEVGAEGGTDPRPGNIPTLFVMTPLGFRPADSTLQCPTVGFCINHPSTIDLSRIGGAHNTPPPPPNQNTPFEQTGGV